MNKNQICTICVLVCILVAGFVSIKADQLHRRYNIESGMTSPRMEEELNTCYAVLDECKEQGILDEAGVECYHQYQQECNLAGCIELIQECEGEENFDDTVGSGDAYNEYLESVVAHHFNQL